MTTRYSPSGRFWNWVVPSPMVVCVATPGPSVLRNSWIWTPETRSPDGLCTVTVRSEARAAAQESSKRQPVNRTQGLLLFTRKGLVAEVHRTYQVRETFFRSRRSPGLRVATEIADRVPDDRLSCGCWGRAAGPSRFHSGLFAMTRLQLRGSAGFAPASQFRPRTERANAD